MASRQNASALEVFANKTKYVSAKFADFGDPFYSTIQAAITAAAGESPTSASQRLIVVYPGWYDELLNMSHYVNLYLFEGVVVGKISPSANGVVIYTTGSNVISCISGRGIIFVNDTDYSLFAINTTNFSELSVQCKEITATENQGILMPSGGGRLRLDVEKIYCDIEVQGCANADYSLFVNAWSITGKITVSGAVECKFVAQYIATIAVSSGNTEIVFYRCYPGSSANGIAVSGGYLELIEGYIPLNSANNVINLSDAGGKLRLKHVRIVNASSGPCVNNAGTLITDNCTFKTAGTYSVTGTSCKNWGSAANKAAQNTPDVEDFIIDTDVE